MICYEQQEHDYRKEKEKTYYQDKESSSYGQTAKKEVSNYGPEEQKNPYGNYGLNIAQKRPTWKYAERKLYEEPEYDQLKEDGDTTILLTTRSGVGNQRSGETTMRVAHGSQRETARTRTPDNSHQDMART